MHHGLRSINFASTSQFGMVKPSQLTYHVPRSFQSNATPSHGTIYPLALSFLVALRDFRRYQNEEGYHILLSRDLYRSLVLLSIFQGNRKGIASIRSSRRRMVPFRGVLPIHETCRSCLVLGLGHIMLYTKATKDLPEKRGDSSRPLIPLFENDGNAVGFVVTKL